ncbi:hypothetical protein HYV79_02485 [Candidatus Woesearchaeota archaeon]|nr:hypothetical protein [Candidatus Woesearchaeota archaeon]
MLTKIQPDKQKAQALKIMAEITLQRLETTELTKYPSNTLTDYYDTLHKIMEAITLSEGIKFKGDGAHQELIDYISQKHNLGEPTKQFLQQMREYRNRISYEGFMINKNYITLNQEKIKNIIITLKEKLEKIL